jgi:hypothetical protein
MFSNLKQWLGLKNQARMTSETFTGRARTGDYQPINHRYWSNPRDLPPFSFITVYNMLVDPEVRMAVATRSAPLYGAEFGYEQDGQFSPGIESDRPEVAVFVERQLKKIWRNHLHEICSAQVWGWSAGEVVLKLGNSKLVEIDRIEPRHAQDTRLILRKGKPCGVEFSRIENEGKLEIGFPQAFFHSHNADPGEHYGQSCLMGAYSPWSDKWLDGGALDVRRLFMHKDAYGGCSLGYPDGETYIDGMSQPIPNRDIARQIVEQIRAGNTIVRPSQRDANGNELWPIERAQVASNPQHILQYPKDLDSEIRTGIGIPDGILNDDGGGAYAGKRIPMAAFYASLDVWLVQILNDLSEQIFEPLVMLNFGQAIDFQIDFKPLAEQAMEQQSNAGAGDPMGGEGMMPPGMMPPGEEGGDMMGGEDPAGDGLAGMFGEEPQQMSIDAAKQSIRFSADASEDDDVQERAELMAEILEGVFGDEAEAKFDEIFTDDSLKMSSWNPLDHPRGPDGRFIERNSPEAVAAAKSEVKKALAGRRTPEALQKVTEHLGILTTKQLRDVKREYKIKAGGAKASLVEKIASRLMGEVSEDFQIHNDENQAPIDDFASRGNGTPENPRNVDVYTVPVDSLDIDPERFQYKISGINKKGVTDELKETDVWNPDLGGVLLVWRDPENQKDYVINGHHRHELASRLGAKEMNVRYMKADSAKEARAKGALANIGEGRGTAIDAAKYMRDTGGDIEHLRRAGISLSGKVAAPAAKLTTMSDKSFRDMIHGYISEKNATLVTSKLDDPKLQDKLFKKLEENDWSDKKILRAAEKMENAGKRVEQGQDLFGDFEEEHSTFDQEVELETYIEKLMRQSVRDWQSGSNDARAERIKDAGNVLQVTENQRRKLEADTALQTFKKESDLKGEVSAMIKFQAVKLAEATNNSQRNEIKKDTLRQITEIITEQNAPSDEFASENLPNTELEKTPVLAMSLQHLSDKSQQDFERYFSV